MQEPIHSALGRDADDRGPSYDRPMAWRTLHPSIFSFLTRVFGLLLSAIAVQLVVNGVTDLM